MINALLLVMAAAQDEMTVMGSGHRIGGEYELRLSGTGKGLSEHEGVSLRFRRLANRLDWAGGALGTLAVGDEFSRTAAIEKNGFVHQERFASPGEVEVVIGSGDRSIRRVFRLSTSSEEANAIAASAKRFDSALRGVRLLVDDVDATKDEMCPVGHKQAQLQKRIDWRRKAYREEIADSFLTASADALGRLMTDIESAIDLERSGKDATSLMFSLSAQSFCWDDAREMIGDIETVSLRERALLTVGTLARIAEEIAEKVRSGAAAGWLRAEKEYSRTIETLFEADQAARTGPIGAAYAQAADESGATLETLFAQARGMVQSAASCVGGAMADDAAFADQVKSLRDRLTAFEHRLRSRK